MRRIVAPAELFRAIALDPPWPERGGAAVTDAWGPGKRGADNHYETLRVRDMPAVVRGSGLFRPAEHAHMYLWVTCGFLEGGLWLMRELGFRYVNKVSWHKRSAGSLGMRCSSCGDVRLGRPELFGDHRKCRRNCRGRYREVVRVRPEKRPMSIGRYFRGDHEDCLFGVRGRGLDPSVCTELKNVRNTIEELPREHSRKPEAFYELVEKRSRGPYLDLFASEQHLAQARDGWVHWGLPRRRKLVVESAAG